ncbi:MAG: helix-hairpin-helix domain-containing protein [Gammaproteobacteria bacterium]|nr:helix-hairpin-helix domain-containing protein [Gammaproteobacteria bacterium]
MSLAETINMLPTEHELKLNHCGYTIEENRIKVNIGNISNHRDINNISGTLSIEIWALEKTYIGGNFNGHCMAATSIGEISGQHYLQNCYYDLIFHDLDSGIWHITLMLREWTDNGYVTRDFVNFDLPYSVNKNNISDQDNKIVSLNDYQRPGITKTVKTQKRKIKQDEALKSVVKSNIEKSRKTSKKKKDKIKASNKININKANIEEIADVKGVSKKLAEQIVSGQPYKTLDELLKVKGIGKKFLERISESFVI